MKLRKAGKKKPYTLREGHLAWNKNVALVKYADDFLLLVPSPSLSELRADLPVQPERPVCTIQRSSGSILCLLSAKRMSLFDSYLNDFQSL